MIKNFGESEAVVTKGTALARLVPIDQVDEVELVGPPEENVQSGTAGSVDHWSRCDA